MSHTAKQSHATTSVAAVGQWGVLLGNEHGVIEEANYVAQTLLDADEGELCGQIITDIFDLDADCFQTSDPEGGVAIARCCGGISLPVQIDSIMPRRGAEKGFRVAFQLLDDSRKDTAIGPKLYRYFEGGMAVMSTTGRFITANNHLEEIFRDCGAQPEVGENFAAFLERLEQLGNFERCQPSECNQCKVVQTWMGAHEREEVWKLGSGIRIKAAYMPQSSGQSVVLVEDITSAIEHDRTMRSAVEQAEKTEAIRSRFLASISHELRTPLNAILGFSDILMSPGCEDLPAEDKAEYLGMINRSGTYLLELINQVLDLSRIDAGRFEIVPAKTNLISLAQECFRVMNVLAQEAGIEFELELADEFEINIDAKRIRQVILNLLSNALKFTPPGRKVTLRVREMERMSGAVIEVCDTGIGIPEDDLATLFMPFEQASNTHESGQVGSGLGLAIAKELVDLHKGQITVESKLNKGSTFRVKLPAQEIDS